VNEGVEEIMKGDRSGNGNRVFDFYHLLSSFSTLFLILFWGFKIIIDHFKED